MNRDWNPGSVVWWGVSSELDSTELREELRSRAASEGRFARDLADGLVRPLGENQVLEFYFNPAREPDLVPLWMAFDTFARIHVVHREAFIAERLRAYGLADEAIEYLFAEARRFSAEGDSDAERIAKEHRALLAAGQAAPGNTRVRVQSALASGQAAELAVAAGISPARAAQLIRDLNMDPYAKVAERTLPSIQEGLQGSEWDAFRRFLRDEVAVQMGPLLQVSAKGGEK